MQLNKFGIALVSGIALALAVADYHFYNLRCEASPPISELGVFIGVLFQAVFVLMFAGMLAYTKFTAHHPRTDAKEYLGKTVIFTVAIGFFGIAITHQALLLSDSAKSRGSRSVGDICLYR